MFSQPFTLLYVVLPILMVDSVIEVGFIGSMVGFLHDRAGKWFDVSYPAGSTFELAGKPAGLLVNQGHTSNGAAGTALILVGVGGFLSIWLQKRRTSKVRRNVTYDRVAADMYAPQTADPRPSGLFTFWVVMTILSNLLTLAAIIYTFVLTSQTKNQTINLNVASQHAEPQNYPLDKWTPENWFAAILSQVPLEHDSDRRKINQQLKLMHGWRWNLIPLFILGFAVAALAVLEWVRLRRSKVGGVAPVKEGPF